MHGIFGWQSATLVHATVVLSPHGNARYFLDGNWPLWYMLPWYSATTVMYGIFYILYILGLLPRACVVLQCQYVHRTRKSPDLEVKHEILRRTQKKAVSRPQADIRSQRLCVCFLSIYSGRQICWKYQPGSHRISHPPSFWGACLYFSHEKDLAVPFPRRP